MEQNHVNQYLQAALHVIFFFAGIISAFFILPRATGFLFPLIIGWCIAWIANPIVKFLEKRLRIRRKQGTAIVIITVILLLFLLFYFLSVFLVKESIQAAGEIYRIWADINANIQSGHPVSVAGQQLPEHLSGIIKTCISDTDGLISNITLKIQNKGISLLGAAASELPDIFVNIILCILFIYFCTSDFSYLPELIRRHIPSLVKERWKLVKHGLWDAFGGYIKAQIRIEAWIFLILLAGFYLLGIKTFFLAAVLISLLDFLPVLGTGTALIPWILIELLDGSYIRAAGLAVLWLLSLLVRQIIQPKIIGDTVGLAPIPTVLLLFFGYRIAGITGMIFAVPVGIIIRFFYKAGMFDDLIIDINVLVKGISVLFGKNEKSGDPDNMP